MRLLYLAYLAPPAGGPRAIRVTAFCKALRDLGWEIDVLTIEVGSSYPYRDESLGLDMPGVNVTRISPGCIYKLVYGRRKGRARGPFAGGKRPRSRLGALLDAISFPDRYVDWVPFALKNGREIASRRRPDLLLVSAQPFSSVLAGALIARTSGVPMVVDLGDPWTGRWRTGWVRRKLDRIVERYCLSHTIRLIVTTQSTKKHILSMFPEYPEIRISVVPNGYDPSLFVAEPRTRADTFRLVYAGSIYGHVLGLESLAEAMAAYHASSSPASGRPRIQLIFLGSYTAGEPFPPGLLEYTEWRGYVSNAQAVRAMKNADALLLMGCEGSLQVPGKIWNYVAARRPILTIRAADGQEFAELVEQLARGPVVTNEASSILQGLQAVVDAVLSDNEAREFDLGERAEHSWTSRVQDLHRTLVEASGCSLRTAREVPRSM